MHHTYHHYIHYIQLSEHGRYIPISNIHVGAVWPNHPSITFPAAGNWWWGGGRLGSDRYVDQYMIDEGEMTQILTKLVCSFPTSQEDKEHVAIDVWKKTAKTSPIKYSPQTV